MGEDDAIFYRRKITEMVNKCNNLKWLRAIYIFVLNLVS